MDKISVLPGPERRRRWISGEKLRIVEESLTAGASVTEIARRHDVHPNLLHDWPRQARCGALACTIDPGTAPGGDARFASVAGISERSVLAAGDQPATAGVIEIELAGARLRITGAVEVATVSAVLAALAGRRR